MGHYLGEMEDDGIPRSMKVHRRATSEGKYSALKLACTQREVERLTGVTLTWDQTEAWIDEWVRRRGELKELEDALRQAEKNLTDSIVRAIAP